MSLFCSLKLVIV